MNNPYTMLGVTKDTSLPDIKKAYRKLAMKHHPDKGGDESKFKEIKEAYEQVKDGPPKPKPYIQFSQQQNHQEYHFTNAEQMADFVRSRRKNSPISVIVQIPMKLAITGGNRLVQVRLEHGTESIDINIPPGVIYGEPIRYAGLAAGRDLIVRFEVIPNPDWEIDGHNLITTANIEIWDLILGTALTVQLINDTEIRIKVQPMTQPNTMLRITGKGILSRRTHKLGDMIVRLNAVLPKSITPSLLSKIKELR